jgi:hypothetical protein
MHGKLKLHYEPASRTIYKRESANLLTSKLWFLFLRVSGSYVNVDPLSGALENARSTHHREYTQLVSGFECRAVGIQV